MRLTFIIHDFWFGLGLSLPGCRWFRHMEPELSRVPTWLPLPPTQWQPESIFYLPFPSISLAEDWNVVNKISESYFSLLYNVHTEQNPRIHFCLIKGSLHEMLILFWNLIRYQKTQKLNFELDQKMNKIYLTLNIKEKREKRKLPGS